MSALDQVLAAVDKFEADLGFTAPELIPMRIGQLREMVRDVFEGDDDWFEVGDADAGTLPAQPQPAPELADDPFGVGAFTGHGPGCGCDDCDGARSDAAIDEPTPGPIYGGEA